MKLYIPFFLILFLFSLTACSAEPEKSEVEVVFEQIEAAVYDAVERTAVSPGFLCGTGRKSDPHHDPDR